MWIRSVARARLIERLLVIAVLVGMLPTGGLTAAPKTSDDTQIWACEQQHDSTLRLVVDRADCARNERAVNLNDTKTPVGVCVQNDDQVVRLARAAKGGSRNGDCDPAMETTQKLPGDAPTPLCARQDGDLAVCAEGSKPDVTVPARNRPANAGGNGGNAPAAGTDSAKTDPAKEKPKERASKR